LNNFLPHFELNNFFLVHVCGSFAKSKEENSFAVIGIAAKQAKRQHRQHGQDTEERSIDLEASSPELR